MVKVLQVQIAHDAVVREIKLDHRTLQPILATQQIIDHGHFRAFVGNDYGESFKLLPAKDFEGFKSPPETLVRSPGHHKDFLEACRDPIGRPAGSNFDYAGGLTETVLLGVLAQRVGQKIEWDAEKMVANVPGLEAIVRPEYRGGWPTVV